MPEIRVYEDYATPGEVEKYFLDLSGSESDYFCKNKEYKAVYETESEKIMSEKHPFISIIAPVYNAEAYIERAVESVLGQTFSNLELILVDDCSTDQSGAICDQWAQRDGRVKVFHLPKNLGAGQARNYGMEKAMGEFLTFLDADDQIDSDLYSKVAACMEQTPCDVVVWGVTERYFDEKGDLISENRLCLDNAVFDNKDSLRKAVIELEKKTLFGYQWNHLYRRKIIMEYGIRFRSVHLYEDYFFNLAYIEHASSMTVLSCTGYYYNKRVNQSLTKQFVSEYFKLSRMRVVSMAEAYRRWGLFDDRVRNSIGERYLRYTFSALMRNCEKQAGMQHAVKRQWIRRVFCDEFYQTVVKKSHPKPVYLKLLQKMIDLHWAEGCLMMGRMLFILRRYLPRIYDKKGQIH